MKKIFLSFLMVVAVFSLTAACTSNPRANGQYKIFSSQ